MKDTLNIAFSCSHTFLVPDDKVSGTNNTRTFYKDAILQQTNSYAIVIAEDLQVKAEVKKTLAGNFQIPAGNNYTLAECLYLCKSSAIAKKTSAGKINCPHERAEHPLENRNRPLGCWLS